MITTRGAAAHNRKRASIKTRSLIFMFVIAAGVITVVFVQATLISNLISTNRQIQSVRADIQMLEARADYMAAEIQMNSRPDIVIARAEADLNMYMPDEEALFLANTEDWNACASAK